MVVELHETCISNTTLVFQCNLDLVKALCNFCWGITELFDFDILVEVVALLLFGHLVGGRWGGGEVGEGEDGGGWKSGVRLLFSPWFFTKQ